MTSAERIRQAREISGLTQQELAERVGLNQSNIARLEQGFIEPVDAIVAGIAIATGFPVDFFRVDPRVNISAGSLLYRKRVKLKSSHRATLRQTARLLLELHSAMAERCGDVPTTVSVSKNSPIDAAKEVRATLGLAPGQPIQNLVRAVERLGVFVIALPFDIDEHDAFSTWATSSEKPILAISSGKSGDRLRFSVAHELGHLILHRSVGVADKTHEREADLFASELLIPQAAMLLEMVPPLSLEKLAELKAHWGVSIQALLVSALRLEVVTTRQYKYLMQKIAVRGWRKKEPVEISVERPRLFRQMVEALYGDPIPTRKVSEAFSIPERLLVSILSVHAGRNDIANQILAPKPSKMLEFKRSQDRRLQRPSTKQFFP